MDPQTLEIRIAQRVAVVWLAREKVRNAFNETMIAELHDAFERLGADPGVRAIVLAARGPAFCAGADLDWMRRMSTYSAEENRRDAQHLADMLRTIHDCPKPTIARVHGDAYAGGMGLLAACDMAFAATGATFCLTETRLGLIPATIGPYVIRSIGVSAARRYMITAEKFDAAEAHRIGLVNQVVPAEELMARTEALAGAILSRGPLAVRCALDAVHHGLDMPLGEGLAYEAALFSLLCASEDMKEGTKAFLEKRKAGFRGR